MLIGGGRYELGEELGTGGMGTVFRGVDTRTKERVAIKVLKNEAVDIDPSVVERFSREAEALRQLNHPNIVRVYDTFEEHDRQYIVMEYVGGGTLRDMMDHTPQMPVDQVLAIALELCDALTRAHHLKIIHRDIKPVNVLISDDGTPRLTDFGVARLESEERVTLSGVAIGTPDYLPPEALRGDEVDARGDIWAFGVMLFEMLAGKRPFVSDTLTKTLTAILTQPIPNLFEIRPDCPGPLVHLIEQMLEKDLDKRLPSIRIVGAEIEAIIRGDTSGDSLKSRFQTPSGTESVAPPAGGQVIYAPAPPNRTASRAIMFGIAAALLALAAIMVSVLIGTGVLTIGGDYTPTPQASVIAPVGPREQMVLVTQIEAIGGAQRDVARFIVNDLKQRLEVEVPYSNVRVRQYDGVVTSAPQALELAEQYDAAVVVWGNYNEARIQLEIQAGSLTKFPYNQFTRDVIERTANVRVQMTDELNQSIAPYVMNVVGLLYTADGNYFEIGRAIATQGMLRAEGVELIGTTTATRTHQYLMTYLVSNETALDIINQAVDADTGNALLYMLRSLIRSRLVYATSNSSQGSELSVPVHQDILTARRLGPQNWAGPLFVDATLYIYYWQSYRAYVGATGNLTQIVMQLVTLRPDDWYALYLGSDITFDQTKPLSSTDAGLETAQAYIGRALAQEPDVITPYIMATLLALRDADLKAAAAMVDTTIVNFPNPNLPGQIFDVFVGHPVGEGTLASVFTQYIIGQYESAAQEAQSFLLSPYGRGGSIGSNAGLFLITGLAHCNLSNYDAAYTAYNSLHAQYAEFVIAPLLQIEVRDRQGRSTDNLVSRVNRSDQAQTLAPYLYGVQLRRLGCRNIFDVDALDAAEHAYTPPEQEATPETSS